MFRLIIAIFILLWLSWFCSSSQAATLIYYRYHIVQKGDTLYDIGKQYGVSIKEIKKKNNLRSDRIYPGQKLIVPIKIKGIYHQVKRYETLWRICKTYRVSMEKVIRLNRLSNPDDIKVGQRLFIPGATRVIDIDIPEEIIVGRRLNTRAEQKRSVSEKPEKKGSLIWPIEGKISEYRHNDFGIDILAPEGTIIIAPAEGKVYFSGWLRGYGIEHEELGLYTCYMHNSVNLVEVVDVVKKGNPVAKIGNTVSAEEIKLHFEVRRAEDGKPVDPLDYLP